MPFVAITQVNGAGDIGGALVTRFHWKITSGAIPGLDKCQVAHDASWAFYDQVKLYLPNGITWTSSSTTTVIDENSAQLNSYQTIGTPKPPVVGTGGLAHAAGLGARANLRTTTVSTRRLMRGCVYLVPIVSTAYDNTGQITSACQQALLLAANNLRGTMTSNGMTLLVYHRPPKGTFTGGKSGPVTAADVPLKPAGLRSRRS